MEQIQIAKPKMLTVKEASEIVDGLTEFRIRKMCVDGILPHIKAGRKYLINQSVFIDVINGKSLMNTGQNV